MNKYILKSAVLVSLCICAASASATEYKYKYTGLPFTNVNKPFTTSDFISFSFTTTALIGNNLVDQSPVAPIQSWALSLGPLSYSSANSVLYSMNFSTNAIGKITGYQFTTQTDVVAPNLLPNEYPPTPYKEEVFSFNLPTAGVADGVYIPSIHQDSYYAYNNSGPGSWTVTAVPEPGEWALMLSGFALTGFMVRRRSQHQPIITKNQCTV